jgi:Flp pilus assembly protein TadG
MKRARSAKSGSAAIEFAIGAMVMGLLFLGTWEFGYAFYVYNNLLAAVDAGAKYAAVKTYDSGSAIPSSAFKTAVQNMVAYGQPTAGTKPVVPGLTPSAVVVTPTFTNGVPTQMTVSLSGYQLNAVVQTFNLSKPSVSYPYLGVYSPP